jgi:hypothetical protein
MQTTQVELLSRNDDNEVIMTIHMDESIRSVTVRKGEKIPLNHERDGETFSVVDLLEDASYFLIADPYRLQLIFPAKQEHVVVSLAPGSDVVKIASYIASNLDAITASI